LAPACSLPSSGTTTKGRRRRTKPADRKCRLNARWARRSNRLISWDSLHGASTSTSLCHAMAARYKAATALALTSTRERRWPAWRSPGLPVVNDDHAAHRPRAVGLRSEAAGHGLGVLVLVREGARVVGGDLWVVAVFIVPVNAVEGVGRRIRTSTACAGLRVQAIFPRIGFDPIQPSRTQHARPCWQVT